MNPYVKIALYGLGISALGTLPLGTLNVAAMQVSIAEGWHQGMYFSLGAALVEIVYVRISVVGLNWIQKHKKLLKWLDWVALAIVIALAAGSFIAAAHPSGGKTLILQSNLPNFFLGMAMSAVSPTQIPFWFGWGTVLFTKKILLPKPKYYNYYIVGIAIGTLLGNSVFIFGGPLIVDSLNAKQYLVNYVIGGIFALTAIIQLVKIFFHKGTSDSMEKRSHDFEEGLHTAEAD